MKTSMNFLVTGVGGQGTVVASDILASVGLAAGYDVKKSDVLGLAVRGGSVTSHIRWGAAVRSPIVPEGQVDVLVAFEMLEGLRWLDQVRPSGAILVNQQRIYPVLVSSGLAEYPQDETSHEALAKAAEQVYVVPGLEIAQQLGNARVLNVVLLGACSALTEIDPQIWIDVISGRVPAKVVDLNVKAFWRGREVLASSKLGATAAHGGMRTAA